MLIHNKPGVLETRRAGNMRQTFREASPDTANQRRVRDFGTPGPDNFFHRDTGTACESRNEAPHAF